MSALSALETTPIPGTDLNPSRIGLGASAIGGWRSDHAGEAELINMLERESEIDVLPYCGTHAIVTLIHGVLCGGMLSGRMTITTRFDSDNPRRRNPKFRAPRLHQYLNAVATLDRCAQANYRKRVVHLALRWALDRREGGVTLWGARQPHQLEVISEVMGWTIDRAAMVEIDRILAACIVDPVGPEFMAPPDRLVTSHSGIQSPTRMLISVGANDVRTTE